MENMMQVHSFFGHRAFTIFTLSTSLDNEPTFSNNVSPPPRPKKESLDMNNDCYTDGF